MEKRYSSKIAIVIKNKQKNIHILEWDEKFTVLSRKIINKENVLIVMFNKDSLR